jgi:periplasmic protein TonB
VDRRTIPLFLLLLAAGCATGGEEIRARAKANLATLISNQDYPAAALRKEEEGMVGFRLTISPEGRVSDCTITQSSGSASLDAATCRILVGRARFDPARDRKGRPVADTMAGRILWRIEKDAPPPPIA